MRVRIRSRSVALQKVLTIGLVVGLALGLTMGLSSGAGAQVRSDPPARVLLLTGGAYHDFKGNVPILVDALKGRGELGELGKLDVTVTYAKSFLSEVKLAKFDAVVVYTQGGRLTDEQERALVGAVEGGKGLVVLHEATGAFAENADYQALVGGRGGRKKTARDLEATVVGNGPIVAGVAKSFAIKDEPLPREGLAEAGATVLVRAKTIGSKTDQPVAWTRPHGKGRVFVTTLGHGKAAVENEAFQRLVYQGLRWVLGREDANQS